jgi:hypothetical protein
MRHGRWIAAATGLAAAAVLVAPAAATVKGAASNPAILQAGLIAAADAPPGWTAHKQPDTGTKNFQGIGACKALVAAITAARHRVPRLLSPQFSDPAASNTSLAEDTVYAFKNVKSATQYLSAYRPTAALTCVQQAFKRAAGASGQATVAPLTGLQGIGDDNAGFEAAITLPDRTGQSIHVVADLIGIRVGRAFLGFDFASADRQIAQGPAIVNAVVSRVRSATR